jgi:hypothetical protein
VEGPNGIRPKCGATPRKATDESFNMATVGLTSLYTSFERRSSGSAQGRSGAVNLGHEQKPHLSPASASLVEVYDLLS